MSVTTDRPLRGEEMKQTKLTEAIVRSIRAEHANTKHGTRHFAAKYGVSRACITQLLKRETWGWVE